MRACVLLAFLAVLLLASTVQAQTRTGFCVSSDIFDGECDVIRDNVVNSQWVDGSYVLQSSLQPLFNITLYPGAPAPATDNVTVTYSTPDGSTNAVWTITEETLTYGQGFFTPLTGSLSCDTEATGSYLITFSSVDLVALTIKFKKQCILPRFDVGSYTHTNNIVDYSVPQKPFQSYVLTEDVQRYDFHVFLSATQSDSQLIILPFSLNLTTPANSILSVTPAKKVGWEGFAMQDPNEFVVGALFSCSNNPLVPVPMTVTATLKDFGWTDRNNIVFTFDYMCGPASPLLGLNVGTTYGTNDVAVNGQAVAPWNSTAFHYAAEVTYTFVLFLSSTVNNNTIPYQINIISEDESTLIITPTTPTNGTLFWTEGSPDVQVFLSEFVCFKAGTVNALAQLRMGEYDPVQMLFSYTCSAPLFNIGTSAGSSNMVSKGVGVGGNGTFPGQNVDKDHDSVDIYLALDPSNTADTNPFHIDFLEPNKNVFSGVTYSDRLAAVASKDLARSAQNPVTLNFECLPCVEAYQEPIVVVFYWGWTNPQTAVFTKDCAVAESCKNPPPSGHHGGMSGAGIAALVIFLLSFAACVAGCAYNKFSLHKGGWAIVPGATAASACFDQVSTKGRSQRWTPQEHDDGSHSANYNAGQEPLATGGYQSYSSNI